MTSIQERMLNAINAKDRADFYTARKEAKAVIEEQPDNLQALFLAASTSFELGKVNDAVKYFQSITEHGPESAEAWYSLGMAYAAAEKHAQAFKAHQKAVRLDPRHSRALLNLGYYFSLSGDIKECLACYTEAIRQQPTDPVGYVNSANAMKTFGMLAGAMDNYEHALKLMPRMHQAMSNICYVTQFIPGTSLARLEEVHGRWRKRFCLDPAPHVDRDKQPDRRLRVGFISADFREHTVGRYLASVFECLASDQFEKYCYYLKPSSVRDSMTDRFEQASDCFRFVSHETNEQLIETVRADKIDVMFDLSGHTSDNRLLVFAQRVAPVQMSWLGYVGTTGLNTMDYAIASETSAPLGVDKFYTEKILRFPYPMAHQCYEPACYTDIGPCPSAENGFVTFGTVSTVAKLNKPLLRLWARILNEVPNSKLLFKAAAFRSQAVCDGIAAVMGPCGIERERLIFEQFEEHGDALKAYNRIDVVLDPMPFSGCTTTCEALWMGVPVVTLPQDTEASRHTTSFLQALELTSFITMNTSDYVGTAVNLANDEVKREALRRDLRGIMQASSVCDAPKYAEELGKMIKEGWYDYCRQAGD